jgi:hypothetical protein
MDCTVMGESPPTATLPIMIRFVLRRLLIVVKKVSRFEEKDFTKIQITSILQLHQTFPAIYGIAPRRHHSNSTFYIFHFSFTQIQFSL